MWSAQEPYTEAYTIALLDPRSSVWGSRLRVVYTSPSQKAPGGVIAPPHCTTPLGVPLTRTSRFQQAPRKQKKQMGDPLTKDGMKHQGTKGAGTLLDVDGEDIRQCPMGCLVLVAPVSSDVFVWTADSLLHTHNWRMGKLRARRRLLEARRTFRDTWAKLFKLCKTAEFPNTEFGTGNQIRDDGEVTQVSLMRAHRE